MPISIEGPTLGQASRCEPILRALPGWFGIEEANAQYLQDIESLPTFVALDRSEVVGFLTLKQHTAYAAEIHIVGVHPERHRRGIGQALLERAEAHLREAGVEYLQVKTLSGSHPDLHYRRTRLFYERMGFRPLEEFEELWGPENPCLQMIKKL